MAAWWDEVKTSGGMWDLKSLLDFLPKTGNVICIFEWSSGSETNFVNGVLFIRGNKHVDPEPLKLKKNTPLVNSKEVPL